MKYTVSLVTVPSITISINCELSIPGSPVTFQTGLPPGVHHSRKYGPLLHPKTSFISGFLIFSSFYWLHFLWLLHYLNYIFQSDSKSRFLHFQVSGKIQLIGLFMAPIITDFTLYSAYGGVLSSWSGFSLLWCIPFTSL